MKNDRLWERASSGYAQSTLKMEDMLERILIKEVDNTDRIHLFYSYAARCWVAFQQSALNLIKVIPEFADTIIEERFADGEMKLTCIAINSSHIKRYSLLLHCTLLGDDYIELQHTFVDQ